jgi:acetyl-CoA carboxylase biotin carboxyl carrier protein
MPVSITRLRELIELAATEGVEGIDLIEGGMRIRIIRNANAPLRRTAGAAAPRQQSLAAPADRDILVAPMFGVLHLTPAPDAKPYVAVGDLVRKGQQLGLIEAMKMFTAIPCDRDGRLAAILAEPGTEITSGQPLFRIVGE